MPSLNRDSYNKVARQWSAARIGFYGRERDYLDLLLEGLETGCRILDLGCGTGRPMAEYLLSKGFRVTGVDQAENLVRIAREFLPQGQWIVSTIENYAFDEVFHAAILWDSLFHIERELHARILGNVVAKLPAQGRLMLTVGGSAHPAFTDLMFGEKFFYDSHSPGVVEKLLDELGCRILLAEFMNVPTAGRDKGRYAIVAEKC